MRIMWIWHTTRRGDEISGYQRALSAHPAMTRRELCQNNRRTGDDDRKIFAVGFQVPFVSALSESVPTRAYFARGSCFIREAMCGNWP